MSLRLKSIALPVVRNDLAPWSRLVVSLLLIPAMVAPPRVVLRLLVVLQPQKALILVTLWANPARLVVQGQVVVLLHALLMSARLRLELVVAMAPAICLTRGECLQVQVVVASLTLALLDSIWNLVICVGWPLQKCRLVHLAWAIRLLLLV